MSRLPLALLAAAGLAGCLAEHAHDDEAVATQTVVIPGPWVFEPANALVTAGEPVTFRNDGGAEHTVTFEGTSFDVKIPPGGEAVRTFDAVGTYEYTCKYHPPDMRGRIIVQEGP